MKPTFYSMFSGGDFAGEGAKAAGCEIIGGIEFDAEIADVARANGHPITVGRVEDVSPYSLPGVPDILWASPVCKNASVANSKGGEAESDLSGARAVAHLRNRERPTMIDHELTLIERECAEYAEAEEGFEKDDQ